MARGSAHFVATTVSNHMLWNMRLTSLASGPYSLVIWFRPDPAGYTIPAAARGLCAGAASGPSSAGGLDGAGIFGQVASQLGKQSFMPGLTGTDQALSDTTFASGWHWLVATRFYSAPFYNYHLYLDGVQHGILVLNESVATEDWGLGNGSGGTKSPHAGTINGFSTSLNAFAYETDFAVFNIRFTAAQVAHIYANRYGLDSMAAYVGATPLFRCDLNGKDEAGNIVDGKIITDDDIGAQNTGSVAGGPIIINSPTWSTLSPFDAITIDLGGPYSTCGSNPISIVPTVTNGYSYRWTTSGDGTFDDDTLLSVEYTPGAGDVGAGTVTLTLEVTGAGDEVLDADVVINVGTSPTAEAGGPYFGNGTTPVQLVGNASKLYGPSRAPTVFWECNGTGTFDSQTIESPIYTPSQADVEQGVVTFTLTVSDSPCDPAVDTAELIFLPLAYDDTTGGGSFFPWLWITDPTGSFPYNRVISGVNFDGIVVPWQTSSDGNFQGKARTIPLNVSPTETASTVEGQGHRVFPCVTALDSQTLFELSGAAVSGIIDKALSGTSEAHL